MRFSASQKIPYDSNLLGFIKKYQGEGYRVASNMNPLEGPSEEMKKLKHEFELEHWQLSEMESINTYPHDYRVNDLINQKCSTLGDLKDHLESCYAENVSVEFSHVLDEAERLWLHQNYEECMDFKVTDNQKVKSLQLLLRAEQMEKFL